MEQKRKAYKEFMAKSTRKTLFARHMSIWKGNKNIFKKIQWVVGDQIHLTQNKEKVSGYCEHSNDPSCSIKRGELPH
jgi:hypothetical protein